jgi:hypothetical protein
MKTRDKKSENLTNNRTPNAAFLKRHKHHPTKFKTQTSLTATLNTYIKFEPKKKLDHGQQTQPLPKLPVLNWNNLNPNITTAEMLRMVPQ